MRTFVAMTVCAAVLVSGCGSKSNVTTTTTVPATSSTVPSTTTTAPPRVTLAGAGFSSSLQAGWTISTAPGLPAWYQLIDAANMKIQWNSDGFIMGTVPPGAIALIDIEAPLEDLPTVSGNPATISLAALADLVTGEEATATNVQKLNIATAATLDGEPAYLFATSYHDNGRDQTGYAVVARHGGKFYGAKTIAATTDLAKSTLDDYIATWKWQ